MPAIVQLILEILGALPAAISAIAKIIAIIKGQPADVKMEALKKGLKAMRAHCASCNKKK